MAENDEEIYDDEAAVDYIIENIFPDFRGKVSREQIQYVLDCEYQYYEDKGFFDDDDEHSVDVDDDEEFDEICAMVRNDGRADEFPEELISAILDANYAYCEENGIFEDGDEDEEGGDEDTIDFVIDNLPADYQGKVTADDVKYILACEDIFLQTMEDHEGERGDDDEISLEDEVNAICYMAKEDGMDAVITPQLVSVVINLIDESFDCDADDEE